MRFRNLVFLCGAGGPGNPCYGVQVRLVNFALHFHCVKVKQRYLTQLAALLFLSFMPRAKGFLANKAHLKVGWGYARRSS